MQRTEWGAMSVGRRLCVACISYGEMISGIGDGMPRGDSFIAFLMRRYKPERSWVTEPAFAQCAWCALPVAVDAGNGMGR